MPRTKSSEPIPPKRRERKLREKNAATRERQRVKRLAEKKRTVCERCKAALICETSGAKHGKELYTGEGYSRGTPFRSCICKDCGCWTVLFPNIGKTEVPEHCKLVLAMQKEHYEEKSTVYAFEEKCGCAHDQATKPRSRGSKRWRKKLRKGKR